MITHYLEIEEQLTDEEKITRQPQIIKIEVANRIEAREKLELYKTIFAGKNYTNIHHIHSHGEENQSCIIEDLNKTDEELDGNMQL